MGGVQRFIGLRSATDSTEFSGVRHPPDLATVIAAIAKRNFIDNVAKRRGAERRKNPHERFVE